MTKQTKIIFDFPEGKTIQSYKSKPPKESSRSVPPEGALKAPILIVGEAPGVNEDKELRPFVGSSGILLRRLLAKTRISSTDVLFTNVFSQRPPRNNADFYFQDKRRLYLTPEGRYQVNELKNLLEILLERRANGIKAPNIIVALGATALKILTGKKRITKWRGSLLASTLVEGFKVYPTYHPSFVLRLMNEPVEALAGEKKKDSQNVLPIFEMDFLRIQSQAETPEFKAPLVSAEIDLPFSALRQRLIEYASEPLIAVDIETLPTSTSAMVWCIGFAKDSENSFCLPLIREKRFAWPKEEEAELLRLVSEIFLSISCRKITQGGTYDLAILGKNYGLRFAPESWEDTLYLHHAIFPTLRKDLGTLISLHTWRPFFKDEGRGPLGARTDRAEFLYNAKDCCGTHEVFTVLEAKAKQEGYWVGYRRTMKILPSHLAMTLRGVRFDTESQAKLNIEFKKKVSQLQLDINTRFDSEINLASSKQKAELLYNTLGLKTQRNPKTKKITTDKDALQKLKKLYPQEPLIDQILNFQKFNKLQTTYTSMTAEKNSRIHTSYSVVSTWRMNSYKSPFGTGGNLQNIPKRGDGAIIRSLFVPDPGKIMIASDRAQAEAMVVAWESKDYERIAMFRKGWDVHWFNAKKTFGLHESLDLEPATEIFVKMFQKSFPMKLLRNLGKTIVHAANYGMGPRMLQTILAREGFIISQGQAKSLLQRYLARNPFLLSWQAKIRQELQETRTLTSALGRKRVFTGRMNTSFFNAGYAFKPQSYVGELTELTIQRLHDYLSQFEALLNVHDEVVGQCSELDLFDCITEIRKLSSIPVKIHNETLDIPVDFKIGYNWQDLYELSLEEQTKAELLITQVNRLKKETLS